MRRAGPADAPDPDPEGPILIRKVEPLAAGWRSFAFPGGCFDAGHRPLTPAVEGEIRTPDHLILVTLRGGAERLEVATDCGHRFKGVDRPGAVSFVPAQCGRRLRLRGVRAAWGSLAVSPEFLAAADLAPFTNLADPFLAGAVAELDRLHAEEGRLDPAYCEAVASAVGHYLPRRYGGRGAEPAAGSRLPAWRLRRIADYVEANLAEGILVADLAGTVGVSAGHLHRAFRATTGRTPLAYVNERRVGRALAILAAEDGVTVAELALRVGFLSPSRFAAAFRRVTGVSPACFRAGAKGRS